MAKTKKKSAQLPDADSEFLSQIKADFLADLRADEKWRIQSKMDADFYDGNQWTEEEKEILQERKQPVVTINRIKPRVDAVFGIQQALRVDTKAFPVFNKENEALAISEKLRGIEDDNDFDDQESLVFEDAVITGRGWYKLSKQWDGLKSRHQVKHAFNEDIILDRHSRRDDLSDAKRIHESVMTELEDAKALFPDYASKLEAVSDPKYGVDIDMNPHRDVRPDQYKAGNFSFGPEDFNEFVDKKRRRIRLVTTYYRTLEPQKMFFHAALEEPIEVTDEDEKSVQTLKTTYPDGEIVTQWNKRLNCVTFAWNCLLEHKKDVRPHDHEAKFPLVLVPGYRERKSLMHYGLIRQMIDPQKEVNKRRSKLLHLLNVNRVRFEEGAFDDESQARGEFVKPDGWIKQRKDFQVHVDNNLDISMAHFQLLQQATVEIDNAAASKEIEGKSSSTSGREFQLRQQQATQSLRKLFSNLRAARRRVALYFLDEILKESPDLAATKYDIIVDEAPESLNLNSETFEQLVSLANSAKIPVPMDMLIKVAPLAANIKNEFIERIKAQEAQAQQMAALQAQMGAGQLPQA